MGVVKITSVYMLMGMLILISLYMKTCSIALLLVFPNLVTYMRFCLHSQKKGPKELSLLNDIDATEQSLAQWKTVLRRDKKRISALRLEKDSNKLPGLEVVSNIVDDPNLANKFDEIVAAREEGRQTGDDELKLATAAVAIPLMLENAARAGSIINVTQSEFDQGRTVGDIFVVSVVQHKTNVQGTCKLMFKPELLARAKSYIDYIRLALVAERGDIPNLFVLKGSKS